MRIIILIVHLKSISVSKDWVSGVCLFHSLGVGTQNIITLNSIVGCLEMYSIINSQFTCCLTTCPGYPVECHQLIERIFESVLCFNRNHCNQNYSYS